MPLTKEQHELNQRRIKEQQHSKYEVDLTLSGGLVLKKIAVYPNVLRPEKTSALYFARYLSSEPALYKDKSVIDMGCGTGVQGIVAGLLGARSVVFSDISKDAAENTSDNVKRYNLNNKSTVFQCDNF